MTSTSTAVTMKQKSLMVTAAFAAVAGTAAGAVIGLWLGNMAVAVLSLAAATVTAAAAVPLDISHHRIPDRLTYPAAAALVFNLLVGACVTRDYAAVISAIVSAAAALVVGVLLSKFGSLGLGDVKLAVVLGLGFGAAGYAAVVSVFVLSFLIAGVVAIALLVSRRMTGGSHIAFAPFLALGAVVTLLMQLLVPIR